MRFCYNATGGGISVVAVEADSTTGTAVGDGASTVSAVVVKAAVVMETDAVLESDDVVSSRLICSSDGAPTMCLSSSE